MNCEICGKSIQGRPLRTKIDGAVLEVCSDCAKLGRIQKQPTSVQQNLIKNKKRVIKKPRNSSQNTSSRVYTRNMDTGEEIVEDYNIYGVSDLDSTPANKAQNEDDFARTELLSSVG